MLPFSMGSLCDHNGPRGLKEDIAGITMAPGDLKRISQGLKEDIAGITMAPGDLKRGVWGRSVNALRLRPHYLTQKSRTSASV